LIRTNIYVAHQITTPALFGIAEPGKLGTRQEMRDGYEIFKNTYINYKQRQIEAVINMIGSYRGVKEPMTLIAVEPIGIEFGEQTIAAVAPKEWILEKLGIDMSQYQTQPQQMSDEFIFEEFGEASENFQVFKKKARFDEYTDYELFATINQTKADILDLISKDKRINSGSNCRYFKD